MTTQQQQTKKRRRRGSGRRYFTQVHEDAIVEYSKTDDIEVKTKLYKDLLEPAFDEMISSIIYAYKFNNLPNFEVLKRECLVWLTTILDKFDPDKGSKAFSYFSVVIKNHFIYLVKKNAQKAKQEVNIDFIISDESAVVQDKEEYDKYFSKREKHEFKECLFEEMKYWEKQTNTKEYEKIVLRGIRDLLEQSDQMSIFNKKAIYLYLRENTKLNSKQISAQLVKIRNKYAEFAEAWKNGEI